MIRQGSGKHFAADDENLIQDGEPAPRRGGRVMQTLRRAMQSHSQAAAESSARRYRRLSPAEVGEQREESP
jgi:hypothetical protein